MPEQSSGASGGSAGPGHCPVKHGAADIWLYHHDEPCAGSGSQLTARTRTAGLLVRRSVERASAEQQQQQQQQHHHHKISSEHHHHNNGASSSSPATAEADVALCPASNSFAKFSKSNGYHSQVLRVSWNIIGM